MRYGQQNMDAVWVSIEPLRLSWWAKGPVILEPSRLVSPKTFDLYFGSQSGSNLARQW